MCRPHCMLMRPQMRPVALMALRDLKEPVARSFPETVSLYDISVSECEKKESKRL